VAPSREWVLNAGHNVDLNDDGLLDPSWRGTFQFPDYGAFSVTEAFTHCSFTGFGNPSVNDDLALLRLAAPLPAGMGYPTLGSSAGIGDPPAQFQNSEMGTCGNEWKTPRVGSRKENPV
jgi:hypothetical protein